MPTPTAQDYLRHNDRVLTARDYRDALQSQNASNLCGLAQTFAEVMKKLLGEKEGTEWANKHPIVTLYLTQFASLNGGVIEDFDIWEPANEICEKRSKTDFAPINLPPEEAQP